ncbi:MAG: hypothetical protein ACRDZ6_09695 [Acidimicrobiales bacterium]
MFVIYAALSVFELFGVRGLLSDRLDELRLRPDRGDVAEKIVIVGIFVLLALAAGAIITAAVTHEANTIARHIVATN